MELPVFTSFGSRSRVIFCSCSSNRTLLFHKCFFRCRNLSLRWNNGRSNPSLRIATTATPAKKIEAESEVNFGDFWEDSQFIEVIGVGSRTDALLNFCLDSPFQSSSLRYWNIISKDPTKVQLQQRSLGNDTSTRNFEAPLSLKSSSKTIVLVASAGYGMDHMTAINIFKTIRSASGFTVAIILKPFSFEGQRRQDEVQDLMDTLEGHTSLFIDIDTDKLLKKDLVTLDEAVKTANNAVLLAITAVSALKSDMHRKLIGASRNDVKEINILEAFNILERYKEAKIGFGAGYSFKTSILQSIYDCPFLSMGVKDLDGMIICIVASSGVINDDDVDKFVHTFRQTTEYTKEIVVSTIVEPTLEPKLLVTTVLTVGFTGEQASQKSGILIRLAQRFPFISRLWGISNLQSSETQGNNLLVKSTSEVIDSKKETGDRNSVGIIAEVSEKYPGNVQAKMSSNFDESHASSESEETEAGSFDGIFESNLHNHITKETPFQREPQREPLDSWNEGLGYQIAQKWAKERASEAGATQMLDKFGIFRLPVGVRSSEELKDGINISSPTQHSKPKADDVLKSNRMINKSTTSSNEPTDTGLEVVRDFYNATSALLKGKYTDPPKGRGRVSVRAASMLEAERDSPKKWNPTVEMKYRGGIYRGRCQGGLPEGKGRLVLGDGSIYDGMWRYGKKSGLGTFYFSNGNVFQGSWRDDVMHGKGWFYFHTGDRWFANFWKGKANGEGRFYSKSGDVIFGQFQEGWRHGEFICIDVDGRRCVENWDQGILVSRTPLDS